MPTPFGSENTKGMHQIVQKNSKIPIKNATTRTNHAKLSQSEPDSSQSSKTTAKDIATLNRVGKSRISKKEARSHSNKSKHCSENLTKILNRNGLISNGLTATKSGDFHPNQPERTRGGSMPPWASNNKSSPSKTSNKSQQNVAQPTDARCHRNSLPIVTKRSDSHSF